MDNTIYGILHIFSMEIEKIQYNNIEYNNIEYNNIKDLYYQCNLNPNNCIINTNIYSLFSIIFNNRINNDIINRYSLISIVFDNNIDSHINSYIKLILDEKTIIYLFLIITFLHFLYVFKKINPK